MDYKKMETLVYSTSWVGNYLHAMVSDQPHHAELGKAYDIVAEGVEQLRKENAELNRKLVAVQQALLT